MPVRAITFIVALCALLMVPSIASAAPKKVSFRFSSTAYSVAEGNKTFNVTVQRQGNTAVAASAAVTDNNTGTAATPANYTFSPVTVNFAAGQTSATVPVTIKDNTVFEPNHTVVLKLTGVTPSGTLVKTPTTTITILENDGPGTIDLSSPTFSVVESAGVATITVTRNSNATNLTESADYTTTALVAGAGHATAGVDYMTTTGTVTFGPNDATKTFQVPILDDSLYEGDETLNVSISNLKNLTNPLQVPNAGPNATASLTIVDDDVPTFAFSNPTYSVNEATGPATITVTRGGATNVPATVNYSDAGTGTATGVAGPSNDYTLASGTLSFAAGETSKTFPVTINDDGFSESNETVGLRLTDAISGNQIATATLSIVDDDNPSASIQFSDVAYHVTEGDTTATITATLSKQVNSSVTVHYATADETQTLTNNPATADTSGPTVINDYTPASGTLTFLANQTTATFQVPIHQDAAVEGDETLDLNLSSPTGAGLGAPSSAVLTIVDDDLAGAFEFTGLTYNAAETDGQATVTVRRVLGSSGAATVDYTTLDGTAGAPADYAATSGTLSFADGETQKTFSVPLVWDGRAEGPETVSLALSNPTGGADLATNTAAVLRIADDGASGPLQLSSTTYNVGESDGLVTITVARPGGSLGGPVSVDYATSDGTATAGTDYTATSGTLTFGPGEATKTFTVPVSNNSVHADAKTFQVALTNATGGANLGSPAGATVTIADDDAAPVTATDPVTTTDNSTPATTPQDNLQSTPGNPNPEGSQTAAADKVAPKVTLAGRAIQKALKAKLLALTAKCSENCKLTVVAKVGKGRLAITLGKAKATAASGKKATLKIKLSKRAMAKLTKALKNGKVKVTISVVAADAAGNKGSATRTITAKK